MKCDHLAISAKLHCPKGDHINESLYRIGYVRINPMKIVGNKFMVR